MPTLTPLVDHAQKDRNQDRDEIDVPYPRRRIVPGGNTDETIEPSEPIAVAQAVRRHHRGTTGAAGRLRCLAASVIPPATPTPSTYIHPS